MKTLLLYLFLLPLCVAAQQRADPLFGLTVERPRYGAGLGPVIFLDEAHNNFHTTEGRYRPFTEFLTKDGYRVLPNRASFSKDALRSARILVIANALNAVNQSQWTLPTPSAFTEEEIEIVKGWVQEGGSLFLIADHMPFPGAAEKLASAFGFTFYNGFAFRKDGETSSGNALRIPDIFTPGKGLMDGPVIHGRSAAEKITSVRTFTGQAFDIPSGAIPIIVLDDNYNLLMCKTAWEFEQNTTIIPAKGLAQGASLEKGKGRVVVFGEAAMFSAQIQRDTTRMGMNAPDAKQNPQLLLNIIHWLDPEKK